eukprot:3690373-Prymnesium_polylepis.2
MAPEPGAKGWSATVRVGRLPREILGGRFTACAANLSELQPTPESITPSHHHTWISKVSARGPGHTPTPPTLSR